MDEGKYSRILGELGAAFARFRPGQKTYDEIVATRDQVFARYQPIFSPEHIPDLTKEEFTSILYFENNHHWSGLYRMGLGAANDMARLRQALAVLLDETRPIRDRFPEALGMVAGLGKAIVTGILTFAYPGKYGVWNNTSEAALRQKGLWPEFKKGEGLGGRYEKINNLLVRLSTDLGTNLWALDAFWWFLQESLTEAEESGEVSHSGTSFALERQLEAFLLENWNQTPLAKEWSIYSTPEEPEAGNQYPTDVGRIDILAIKGSRDKPERFLVIELKRNQSTDQTVGQALRYVGWIKKHLATEGQSVEALIVAHKADKEMQYALSTLDNVRMMTYEVEFRLRELEGI